MSEPDLGTAMPTDPDAIAAEFRRGWPVILGANLGLAIGLTALPGYSVGIFMRALQAEFGWTRGQISLAPTLLITVLALVSPALGWLTDRVRTAWICGPGLLVVAIGLAILSRLGPSLTGFQLSYAALGLLGCGASALPYARAVSGSFLHRRGLALGVAMIGTGLSAMIVPALLAPYAAREGWRAGYLALAVVAAAGSPFVVLLMLRAPKPPRKGSESTYPGYSFAEALRTRAFWTLAVCFVLIPLGVGGLLLHLMAFLSDAGLPPAQAGAIAGLAGAFQIASRVGVGWIFDRAPPRIVAASVMGVSAACLGALAVGGASVAILAPLAFGLAMGAEIDLVGYMTAHLFGLRAYGRLYGALYGTTMGGTALSPLLYGNLYDATHSYTLAISLAAAMLATSALLLLTLPRARLDLAPIPAPLPA